MKIIQLNRFIPFFSVALLAFLLGFTSYHFKVFPHHLLREAFLQMKTLSAILNLSKPHHIYKASYSKSGAYVFDKSAIYPGYTLLTSFWKDLGWKTGIKLIDVDGSVIHTWNANPADIWGFNLKTQIANYVHGSYLFPNGDILFNIEYTGLVRMDSCGKVLWKLDYVTHHSIFHNEDGTFWVSGSVEQSDPSYLNKYPGLNESINEDHALLISADGMILKDINLLDIIYKNNLQRYLPKYSNRKAGDIFHLNDVESLSRKLSDEYPLFEAGDILVSLNKIDLVIVLDPNSGLVKWHDTISFIGQHDPDFIGDGWIGIFDNNKDFTNRGKMLGGSRIIALRPHTNETKTLYKANESKPFYTSGGGKWQSLDNGNMLIVEARAGRAFEVDKSGKVVWEWFHERYEKDYVSEVLEATRYSYAKDQISSWPCSVMKK
jgi:hypothetical protein